MDAGNCYHITTPPNGKHWFVVAFPISGERFLLLPFTTKKAKSDTSCVILPGGGSPSFIEHETIIGYRDALELTQLGFEDASKRGHCRPSGEVSKEMLERILQSGLESKFLKNKWKLIIARILEGAAVEEPDGD